MTMTPLRRRIAAVVAALLGAVLMFTACAGNSSDNSGGANVEMRSFEADNGTIEIPVEPQRIVTSGSQSLFLSLGVEPVGVTEVAESILQWLTPDERAVYEDATQIGGGGEFDYEQIVSLNPDLIVIYGPQHSWDSLGDGQERLQSIAPTVWIDISDMSKWKTQGQRVADAVGAIDQFDERKAAYDELAAEISREYADVLDTTTFAFVNRYAQSEEGTFTREYYPSYCTAHLPDIGLRIAGEAASDRALKADALSMENLSELTDADVIIYAAGADGKPKPELAPVLESNTWNVLPQVADGRAFGVKCNGALNYPATITNLESLQEVLGTLAASE